MANYLSVEKRKMIFQLLCEGNGLRSVTRIVGCSKCAVSELQKRLFGIIEYLNRRYIKELDIENIEADEIRTFVLKKTNVKWVYIALDRDSRTVIHFHIGKRDANDAKIFLMGLSDKLKEISKVSTDCLKSYVTAVADTPLGYWPTETNSIYLLRARRLRGELNREITNRVETHNGNVRQHVSRMTRRTRCFSKKQAGLYQQLSLFFFYYNFIKVHKTLKIAPALAAKIIKKPFSIDDLIQYDILLTGKVNNINTIKNYGRIENTIEKSEVELFIEEMKKEDGMKNSSRKGEVYNKLKVVA